MAYYSVIPLVDNALAALPSPLTAVQAADWVAAREGLLIPRCAAKGTGLKGVRALSLTPSTHHHLDGFRADYYCSKKKRMVAVGANFVTDGAAALALARVLGSKTPCGCRTCLAAKAPPPTPAKTEEETRLEAESEGLELTKEAANETGYKYIHVWGRSGIGVQPHTLQQIDELDPGTFPNAWEAAIWLARKRREKNVPALPPRKKVTVEEVEEAHTKTTDGEAFGGLFGGFACGHAFAADAPESGCCGRLYRTSSHALWSGRLCRQGGKAAWIAKRQGHVPVYYAKQGPGGLCMESDPPDWAEDPTDFTIAGRVFDKEGAHRCRWVDADGQRCEHIVHGFGLVDGIVACIGASRANNSELLRGVERHEAEHLREMPMTVQEVERACFDSLTGRKRILELERDESLESGFVGVRRYREVNAGCTGANKKRYHVDGIAGATFTAEETALRRARKRSKGGASTSREP